MKYISHFLKSQVVVNSYDQMKRNDMAAPFVVFLAIV
jgi:hypothetical protein